MLKILKRRINCNYIYLYPIQNIWGGGVLKQKKGGEFLGHVTHFSVILLCTLRGKDTSYDRYPMPRGTSLY